jgi:S1-C subfamily serine protease
MPNERTRTESVLLYMAGLLSVAAMSIVGTAWWMNSRQPPVSPASAPMTTVVLRGRTPAQPQPPAPDLTAASRDVESGHDAAAAGFEDVISRSAPAVVAIQTQSSSGSGFFVASDIIVTNLHVVGTDTMVVVRRPDGSTTPAYVQTTSPAFDIAVLKVSGARIDQAVLPLATTAGIRIGEEVIAIGTPLGFLQNTVSRGIVSGLRVVGGATMVQTDASINPGNSGGPLLNKKGAVIGVIRSAYLDGDKLGFAVAVDHARDVVSGRLGSLPETGTAAGQYQALSPVVTSVTDQERIDTARAYEDAIVKAGRNADTLDEQWKLFAASCYEGRIAGGFERPWFALWESAAMQGVVSSRCVPLFSDFRRQAEDVRQAVVFADEAARRAGIFPGTRRDVLRRNKVEFLTR